MCVCVCVCVCEIACVCVHVRESVRRRDSHFCVLFSCFQTNPFPFAQVVEVYEFVKNLPGCQEYADEFRQQEIDGQALLLLKEDHLMTNMNIKLGPALKICARINALREEALSSAAAPTTPTS